jgi:MFS transporter, FHS family, glucose/mannose:H+ symporter
MVLPGLPWNLSRLKVAMVKTEKNLLFTSACLGLLLFGVTLTTLGSILPEIISRFEITMAEAGFLFTLMNLGILTASLVFGPVVDRFGYKKLMTASTLLILLGMEGVAFSPGFGSFSVFIFIFGFGGGLMNGAANALVSDISEGDRSAKLSLLGVFFGAGAFGVPLILGVLLDYFSYSQVIATIGILVLIVTVFYLLLSFPEPKQPHTFPVKEAVSLVKHPILLLLAFILFFQSGMEITAGGWIAAYFNDVLKVNAATSVLLLSFFWIGMMLSRLAISKLVSSISPAFIIKFSMALAMAASLLLLNTGNTAVATVSIFLLGAGFAAIFPLILGYIGDLYPGITGTAFSFAFTVALTGGMLLPYLAGVFGDAYGLRFSFLLIPTALVATYILFILVLRVFAANHPQIKP